MAPPISLETAILLGLAHGHAHSQSLVRRIRQLTDGRLDLNHNSIYGVLDRLAASGHLDSWEARPTGSEGGRPRRHFSLTETGVTNSNDLYRAIYGLMVGRCITDAELPESGPITAAVELLGKLDEDFLAPNLLDPEEIAAEPDPDTHRHQSYKIELFNVLRRLRPLRSLDEVLAAKTTPLLTASDEPGDATELTLVQGLGLNLSTITSWIARIPAEPADLKRAARKLVLGAFYKALGLPTPIRDSAYLELARRHRSEQDLEYYTIVKDLLATCGPSVVLAELELDEIVEAAQSRACLNIGEILPHSATPIEKLALLARNRLAQNPEDAALADVLARLENQ